MSLTKLSLAGNNLLIPGHGEFGFLTSRLRKGELLTFFYSAAVAIYGSVAASIKYSAFI